MLRKVAEHIRTHNLIEDGDKILVGVSGGADSVCLLHVLYTLYQGSGVSLHVVHVNHGIRKEEAERDENFVRSLCERLKLPYRVYYFDVAAMAKSERLSEEEAGRIVRYKAFAKAAESFGCNKVAVAHNKNDNAETFLLNLFRGSAVKGLTGMDPVIKIDTGAGTVTVIRPLLAVTRDEIMEYIHERGLEYREDSTNQSNAYTRNRIRNHVLGYVREHINSNAIEHITSAAEHIGEAYGFIEKHINERYEGLVNAEGEGYEYDPGELMKEDPVIRKGIVRRIFKELSGSLKDIDAKHTDEVLALGEKQVGKMIHLPYGMIAAKGYDRVRIYIPREDDSEAEGNPVTLAVIQIPGRTQLCHLGLCIETEVFDYKKDVPIPKNSCVKWFDYDKIENTLMLRTRKAGDYLQIDQTGGTKKLKDYFIDEKVPRDERDKVLLVADGSHILWIIGYGGRISEKYKLSDISKRILSMNIINSKEKEHDR